MRVFVAGATGVIGQYLVPGLITGGHEVTASTRSPLKANQLKTQGATPVVVDGLDREAVLKAVTAAQPEVIIHQMTALTSMTQLPQLRQGVRGHQRAAQQRHRLPAGSRHPGRHSPVHRAELRRLEQMPGKAARSRPSRIRSTRIRWR